MFGKGKNGHNLFERLTDLGESICDLYVRKLSTYEQVFILT